MKIFIPMAGFGTRLRPHTWSKPKPLVTIAGKPILGHVLDMFASLPDVDEVVFIVGYLGEQVRQYVGDAYPHLNAVYVTQDEMLGQSHALWLTRERLSGPALLVFVDTLIETDLSRLSRERADAVGWVKRVEDPRRFGVAEVDAEGWVKRLTEKPEDMSNNLAVVGFYYFSQSEALASAIEEQMERGVQLKGEYYLADAINIMLDRGLRMRVEPIETWKDCGKPETLLETNRYLLENGRDNSKQAAKRKGLVIIPPVYIAPSAKVEHSVIGPHVSIADDCVVEQSIIRDSVIEARSRINDSALSSSLIGREARVSGRYRTLNVGDSSEVGFT